MHSIKEVEDIRVEEVVGKMGECRLCRKNGEDLTLVQADHKELGQIMVCEECWKKLWNENRMVCGSSGSGGTCPSCR